MKGSVVLKNKSVTFLNILWIFTMVYFCLGRFKWIIPSYFFLLLYLFLNYYAMNLGYRTLNAYGSLEPSCLKDINVDPTKSFAKIKLFFIICCCATIFFEILWVTVFVGSFSVKNVLDVIGSNYFTIQNLEFKSTNPLMQIRTLFWIVTYFTYPIGFMYFRFMTGGYKLLFCATVVVEILASLNMGVSKNIGDLVIIYLAVLFLKTNSFAGAERHKSKQSKRMLIKIAILLMAFLMVFAFIQRSRDQASSVVNNPFLGFAEVREFSLFDLFLGKNTSLSEAFNKMGYYLSHGYAGLAYALELPHKSTYGLGFSNSLLEYAKQYLGLSSDIIRSTYNYRLESVYGWKDGEWWSTSFVRIGNSVSFWFVPVVMFLLGRLFKNTEINWYREKDVTSLVLNCQLFIGFVYASCNLQIFQSRPLLIATTLLLFIYFSRRLLKNKRG